MIYVLTLFQILGRNSTPILKGQLGPPPECPQQGGQKLLLKNGAVMANLGRKLEISFRAALSRLS